ncbi:MAG: hypothetical protein KKC37_15265 [Proteobacteria bacterium]|nr:hypothetical protein [Pseudomonadota bacterium]
MAGGQGDFSLTITTPKNGDKLAYGLGRPGKLRLTFIAQVTPKKYANKVRWTFPTIKGSQRKVTYPTGRKTFVRVTYTKLPPKNSAFGPKVVKARLEAGGCRVSDQRRFYVFYPLGERNNPAGKYPNWFYYWRQTPAARPYGQRVRIEYGGTWFKGCKQRLVPAIFHPGWAYKTLHVCDLSRDNFRLDYPLINRYWVNKFKGFLTARYIDVFALAVIHEYVHQRCYHAWRAGKTIIDNDQDGIPDGVELGMKFSPKKFQTYYPQKLSKIGGDEEWLAYEEMGRHNPGQFKKHDWAAPGSQWP